MSKLGHKVHAESLIRHEPFSFQLPSTQFHWVFFSSPRAVEFFFKHSIQLPTSIKWASLGRGTSKKLSQFVDQIHFEGTGNDTHLIAEQFKVRLNKGEKVLFPQAKGSLRTVPSVLVPEQCIEINSYQTLSKETCLGAFDVYVFTSPSNVNSFFIKNNLSDNARIVAIGKSTAIELKKYYSGEINLPWSYSPLALTDAVV